MPTLREARYRHAGHYRDIGAECDRLYLRGGAEMKRGLTLFDEERAHIESSLAWLQTEKNSESGRLFISLMEATANTGQELRFHPSQRMRLLEAQVSAARRLKNRSAEAGALGNLGLAAFTLGDARRAIEFQNQALGIARELGDRQKEHNALGNLGLPPLVPWTRGVW